MQRALARAAAAVTWLTLACPIGGAQEPRRPQLPRGADDRHWEPYFDHGVQRFKRSPIAAEEAFYWASRIDPTRAEPLFGRYAAFFAHTRDRDVAGYFRDDAEVWSRPEVRAADSTRMLALVRNPFVHRGLEILIFDRMPGNFAVDRETRAWIAYSNGDFAKAVTFYSDAIARGGAGARWRRFDRALAYAAMDDAANALADLRAVLAALRAEEQDPPSTFYRSKHFVLYMIGYLQMATRDLAGARATFEEAVVEDASFAYAHAGLATIARLQREPGRAVDALGLAVELAPGDPVLRQERGELLLSLQRLPEAAADFTRAAELEPFWPAPVLGLARVREREGQGDAATTLYRRFVGMAPADDAQAAALRQRGIVP